MKFIRNIVVAISALAGVSAFAQIATYSFGTTTTPTTSATLTAANTVDSVFSSNLGSGTTGTTSPGSSTAGGGGGAYFIASNWRASDANYFSFTITPNSGYTISVSDINFYYAASSSGPTSATLYSSTDAYATALANFTITRQAGASLVASDWHLASSSIILSSITTATTFRLAATGASGSTGTLRIDAVTLGGTVNSASPVPEPSTYAAIAGVLALGGVMWQRRRQRTGNKQA